MMSEEGSEGSPSQPKRKIKKVMVLSSTSDSDSDESVGAAQGRKRRLRVVSDNECSDSSGSSVVRTGARRKRALPKLRDSDDDGNGSGWMTDHSNTPQAQSVVLKLGSGFASDSSEGNSDKCSICLMRFTDQQVGTPQTCEHLFCLDCITEWSKNVNTCPVDRITFNSIVVRAYAGGKVLRTEPVMVVERRPSVDILVVEDPTVCEICGSTDNEELMLLCDGCDLGFHMQCLTPPLTMVPVEQWFCDSCVRDRAVTDLGSVMYLSEIDDIHSDLSESYDLYSELMDIELPLNSRPSALRENLARNNRRSSRISNISEEPSTSSGRRGDDLPTTSRGSRPSRKSHSGAGTSQRRPATTRRRKYKRRRTKTVIVEYEVKEDGKFPVTKRVKRRVKKQKARRRQPRTVARRSHVRRSVRAKLASMGAIQRVDLAQVADAVSGVQELCMSRRRAGIPPLRLFGNPNELDYFSEDDNNISEGATTAVAARPTSSIFSAYRQARRKMITIPSPPQASSAPDDLLSGILESQSLLHSKKSVMSITVDGQVNIKLHKNKKESTEPKSQEKIDISKGEDATKKVPSYPGQSRGGGGNWGGGYRGNYHRDQGANFNRGNNYDNNHTGSYQNRQGNMYHSNNMHRDELESFGNFPRRPHQYSLNEDSHFDRSRRPNDSNRGPNFPNAQRFNDQSRHSIGSSWQPFSGGASGPRHDYPQPHTRHSFGGFENPLDMRMGPLPESNIMDTNPNDLYSGLDSSQEGKSQLQTFEPLPEPPVFKFDTIPEIEKSEDEKSDSGLVIDTDKYDPTEPTLDDESGDESAAANVPTTGTPHGLLTPPQFELSSQLDLHSSPETAVTPPLQHAAAAPSTQLDIPTSSETVVQDIIAGMDSTSINVPPNVLDDAVRQVLKEHRNLIVPPSVQSQNEKSDEESDGDCPNFSIYSATSVHIANNTNNLTTTCTVEQPEDNLEDLVQEDDDVPENVTASAIPDLNTSNRNNSKNDRPRVSSFGNSISYNKSDDVYKEKISKRCPITTNTRNPIKIKINTPSLIKRQVALYDEEDTNEETDTLKKPEAVEQTESKMKSIQIMMDTEVADLNSENDENMDDIEKENEGDTKKKEFSAPLGVNDLKKDKNETEEISNKSIDYDDIDSSSGLEKYEEKESAKLVDNNLKESYEKSENETQTDEEIDDLDAELDLNSQCSKKDSTDRNDEALEKMTESISETEDERSYTPCLDENKSKDTSMETEKEKGIEGLDTEMISEDEGNEMFSDNEKVSSELSHSPPVTAPVEEKTGKELVVRKDKVSDDDGKKKKKKDSKKEGKEKNKSKGKKSDVPFKKLIKSGKERNYREREKDEKNKSKRDQRGSSEEREKQRQKRKEKRKDLERYDVRTLVTEKRRIKIKDAFGRDISPIARSRSPSTRSEVGHRSQSRGRRSPSGARSSIARDRLTPPRDRRSPLRARRSSSRGRASPVRGRLSPVRARLSPVRARPTPIRARRTMSRPRSAPRRRPRSATPLSSPPPPARRPRLSVTPRSISPHPVSPKKRSPSRKRRKSTSPRRRRSSLRRRRSTSRKRPRRSASGSPKPKSGKKKKRDRSERPSSRMRRRESPRKKSPKRKKNKRRSISRSPPPGPAGDAIGGGVGEARGWSPLSVDSRLLSPRTPPPDLSPGPRLHLATLEDKRKRKEKRRRRDADRLRHGRSGDRIGPSKEVFTSGDNILVSVSFKDQERERAESRADRRKRQTKRDKRKKRKRPSGAPDTETAKPVAIIDLERSPFRELTPSPKNVIILSDSDHGDKGEEAPPAPDEVPPHDSAGPKTPPEPVKFTIATKPAPAAAARAPNPLREEESGAAPEEAAPGGEEAPRGPNTPPDPPSSPDAYDPFEPTRSASASPAHVAPSPPRPTMTLEAAQKTNMSADEVLDRRPLSPMEKVMALLQSTRDVSPEPPPPPSAPTPAPSAAAPPPASTAPPVRIVLPSPTRAHQPKLFPAKPSPIKSTPIKPLQSNKLTKLPLPGGDSPYSPGSSDFGDLFEPPPGAAGSGKRDTFDLLFGAKPNKMRKDKNSAAKVPVKLNRKKGNKTQVGVKIDEDNLKILDELPSSAVEMQVKSKFLKKLNRQERVVEEVKLVLKPHYNKKHVTKEEYKHILRRAVPKICHNKTGEINPSKIQALIEAYVKKLRKKHKVGV